MEPAAKTNPIPMPIGILFKATPIAVPIATPNPIPLANLFEFSKINL